MFIINKNTLYTFIFYSIFIGIILTNPNHIKANTIIFSENFDDNNIDDWLVVRNRQYGNQNLPCMNTGNPAQWIANEGKLTMDIVNSPSCITEIIPSNFSLSNVKNYSYEFDMRIVGSTVSDRNAIFLWQDVNNWYDIKLYGNSIIVQKVVDGRVSNLPNSSSNFIFSNNQMYRFRITIEENIIKIYINENQVLNIQDSEPYISGYKTVGLQASVGSVSTSRVQFDNIVVKSLDNNPQSLPVENIKQTDTRWADMEYDNAGVWSPSLKTIKDWGCALTSVVMIMKYHGIHNLADGTPLDPGSLNTWLLSQNDGYLQGGLVNWFAIGRLTKTISQAYGTPKLEYTRKNGSDITTAHAEITQNKPVILQIPGHFIVGTGVLPNDIAINDPYYAFSKFSEHTKTLLSTRMFQPSQTDLSGFIIATPTNTTITLTHNNQPVATATQSAEFITEPQQNRQSPTINILEYSKPATGQYNVTLNTPNPYQAYSLEMHMYNQDGSVTSHKKQLVSGSGATNTLTFTYDGQNPIIVSQSSSFETLLLDINDLFLHKQIQKKYIAFALQTYIRTAQTYPQVNQVRWANFIKNLITKHQILLTSTGKEYLIQELQTIKENLEAD